MKNKIIDLFNNQRNKPYKSIYFTAGFPNLEDTPLIIELCQKHHIDFLEIGIPYSDPVADGPIIESASQIAIKNGVHLNLIFEQIKESRKKNKIPILLMGYFNSILKFGIEKFAKNCQFSEIDGVIIPDLPMEIYLDHYQALFEKYNISFIPLITQDSDIERIHYLDNHTQGFLYLVSSHGTTGGNIQFENQIEYFKKIRNLNLKNPLVAGFGIKNKTDIEQLQNYIDGTIIGSAFVEKLKNGKNDPSLIQFLKDLN